MNYKLDLDVEDKRDLNEIFKENPDIDFKQIEEQGIKISKIRVKNKRGEKLLGKKMGYYSTFELPKMMHYDVGMMDKVSLMFGDVLKEFISMDSSKSVLVIGLGNRNITADSLGPKVVSKLFVTRHFKHYASKPLFENISSVCALSPGVLGTTGIETSEIVKSLVDKVKPDYVLCIDSLAAGKVSRLNTTIQVGNTGINPGAGVNNHRTPLNEETLGVPVLGIGVPTVVDVVTIVNENIDSILKNIVREIRENKNGEKNFFSDENQLNMIRKKLSISIGEMVVTPKDVDTIIESMSKMIAMGINIALHPNISVEDLNRFTN